MHQTHHPLRSLNSTDFPDKNVQALFATKPDSRAILFVHGYGGDPVKTWSEFHDLLPEQEHFSGVDLLFYGYDSLQTEMIASAALFHEFLDRLFSDGVKVMAHRELVWVKTETEMRPAPVITDTKRL